MFGQNKRGQDKDRTRADVKTGQRNKIKTGHVYLYRYEGRTRKVKDRARTGV